MPAHSFEVGKCYYMLSFFDEALRCPDVEVYVYIGQDLMGEVGRGEPGTWYFKKSQHFAASGGRLEEEDLSHCIRVCEDTAELMLDIDQLCDQLRGAPK